MPTTATPQQPTTPTLTLTPREAITLQTILTALSAIAGLMAAVQSPELASLSARITSFIGQPEDRAKRREVQRGIAGYYGNDPECADMLRQLDEDYPPPPAFVQ